MPIATGRKEARNAGRDLDKAQEEDEKLRRRLDEHDDAHSPGRYRRRLAAAAPRQERHLNHEESL